MIARLREWAYRRHLVKPVELPAFTVSVGNISMGGTGKSAFVMLLAEWAAARRIPTVVLTRGYKRKSSVMEIVAPGAKLPGADELGDEPWMIKRRVPGVALLVHHDRARKALRHWKELAEPRLALLDDGFQHWRCARDLDVLMIDATESLEQRALPFGRLRETVLAARRADLIVITHARSVPRDSLARLERRLREASVPRVKPVWKRATLPAPRIVAASYEFEGVLDAVTGKRAEPEAGAEYLLVSGIAKPDHLRAVVKAAGLNVREELYFPDHHRLTAAEEAQVRRSLAGLRNGRLLVTEKDWGRWKSLFGEKAPGLVLTVKFAFEKESEAELEAFFGLMAKGAQCSMLP